MIFPDTNAFPRYLIQSEDKYVGKLKPQAKYLFGELELGDLVAKPSLEVSDSVILARCEAL